jgi:methionyl-tRNA formyltransferase
MNAPLRLVFMGTPDFAVPSLNALAQTSHDIVAVVTRPDKPKGRGLEIAPSPVKVLAQHLKRKVLQPDLLTNPSFREELLGLSPDLIVIVAFKILPLEILRVPRLGAINLHASLLPKYRGAAPIQRAMAAGETVTGLTVFFLSEVVDGGDVIRQMPVNIGPEETAGQLSDRLKVLGADLLVESVESIARGNVRPLRQEAGKATSAPRLKKEEGKIDFTRPAGEIYNRIRAFTPVPGAYTFHHGKRLQVLRAALAEKTGSAAKPGTVIAADAKGLRVQAGEGVIALLELKPENKRAMSAQDFLNGFRVKTNDVFTD